MQQVIVAAITNAIQVRDLAVQQIIAHVITIAISAQNPVAHLASLLNTTHGGTDVEHFMFFCHNP